MKTNTLISNQTIFDNSNIDSNIQSRKLRPSVLLAQDTDLQDLLGTDLYNFIYDKRTTQGTWSGLTATQTTFVDDYMTPVLIYYVISTFVKTHPYDITNLGISMNSNENTQSIETKDIEKLSLHYRGIADFYAQRLKNWMNEKINNNDQDEIFALYDNTEQNLNPSNIVSDFGIYIPSERCGCSQYNCICGK